MTNWTFSSPLAAVFVVLSSLSADSLSSVDKIASKQCTLVSIAASSLFHLVHATRLSWRWCCSLDCAAISIALRLWPENNTYSATNRFNVSFFLSQCSRKQWHRSTDWTFDRIASYAYIALLFKFWILAFRPWHFQWTFPARHNLARWSTVYLFCYQSVASEFGHVEHLSQEVH